MKKASKFLGIHAMPDLKTSIILALIPFIIVLVLYVMASNARLKENPDDKVLPSLKKIVLTVKDYAFTENKRSGGYIMFSDTVVSMKRLGTGILIAAIAGLLLGLNMGIYPGLKDLSFSFTNFISIIPPMAILPVLLIAFGTGEYGKIMLIFIGTFPMITRDVYISVKKISKENITKSLTLGASGWEVAYKITLPQIMPRLIYTVRLSLGAAWVYLIAAEAISATEGLGYRIFLVRRYLAMDVIIPYVIWITIIGFSIDLILRKFVEWKYPWYSKN